MDAVKTLAEKAVARSADPMTGHWVKSAGPFAYGAQALSKLLTHAPKVESAVANVARRGAGLYGRAFKAKPKMTMFGTGLGLGGLNDAAGAIGLPNIGGWDPAAHAERMDPKLTGWRAAATSYLHPLQSLLGTAGFAGTKTPISMKRPDSSRLSNPTNLRFGPDGRVIGTASQDVDMELSPRMQQALDDYHSGNDPSSILTRGLEASGLSPGSLLGRRRPSLGFPSTAEQAPRLYADPTFVSNSRFARQF